MTSQEYRVEPAALTATATVLTTQADRIEQILSAVVGARVADSAFGAVDGSAHALSQYRSELSAVGRTLDTANQKASSLSDHVVACRTGYTTLDQTIAQTYRTVGGLSTAPAAGPAAAPPTATGPFASQISANRTRIAAALPAEQAKLAALLSRKNTHDSAGIGGMFDGQSDSALDKQIASSESRIALYQDVLSGNRQIIGFDPNAGGGNGRIVEQIGSIDSSTSHVGVLVPGTFSSIANHETYAHTAQDMVNADPDGSLAMIVYSDGGNPQSLLTGAPSPVYAEQMAPDLAAFSHRLRDGVTSSGSDASITYVPHSYAASTMGAAEQQGLDADNIVRVEGAGMGPGIETPADLPDYGTVHYSSMTAPDDPIALIQNDSPLYPIVNGVRAEVGPSPLDLLPSRSPHGADPDTFPGTTQLDPGYVPHNPLLPGVDANEHTAVLKPYSPSWWNLFDSVSGRPVTTVGGGH